MPRKRKWSEVRHEQEDRRFCKNENLIWGSKQVIRFENIVVLVLLKVRKERGGFP
jgi:hypothetical protein